ncbi:CoA transferase [SAR202 cluster bacterium AD-802-E10_MRT_200m]|nr:CoA transferase [SAR202 cluster bacterium AD-802-E10_MRT_200m]
MTGPLDGIKILDFTEIIAGPFGSMLLADMGADVIKIEPPWGEPWRNFQSFRPFESRQFISLNRGKRSLPLDLTKREAREIIYKLLPQIDVVVINYRPDVPYKLGIDYETLSAINPQLIYCENTAYGSKGPHSQRPGYDIIIQALSGLTTGNGKLENGLPQQINPAAADFSTGLAIAWGVSSALYSRERNGQGQKIEATLLATALGIQTGRFLQIDSIEKESRDEFLTSLQAFRDQGLPYSNIQELYDENLRIRPPGNIYYRAFQTKDNVIVVGCLSETLRKKMAAALNLHDIRFDSGYDPSSEEAQSFGETLTKQAEALFKSKTTDQWIQLLDTAGVPCGPIKFTEELLTDPQIAQNGLSVDINHSLAGPMKMVGPILQMHGTPMKITTPSPVLGQDTADILQNLGYSLKEVQVLKDKGITR